MAGVREEVDEEAPYRSVVVDDEDARGGLRERLGPGEAGLEPLPAQLEALVRRESGELTAQLAAQGAERLAQLRIVGHGGCC
jgi:uncharacterized protein involved in exopolysaccharide biosynthesis